MTTNALDDAVARLQDLALACTSVKIKSAPDYPVNNAEPAPFSIAHIASASGQTQGSGMLRVLVVAHVDFYFSLVNLKQAYQQLDAIALEFMQRLAGDPTLNGKVSTVNFESEVTCEDAGAVPWGSVPFHLLRFTVPFKLNSVTL
jgi:hypothetical protein